MEVRGAGDQDGLVRAGVHHGRAGVGRACVSVAVKTLWFVPLLVSQVSAAGLGSKSPVPRNAPEICTSPLGVTLNALHLAAARIAAQRNGPAKVARARKTEDVGRFKLTA